MRARCLKLPGQYATTYLCDNPDDRVVEHSHEYAHWCSVVSGSVRTVCDGKEVILASGESIIFPAGSLHSIHALELNTVFINSSSIVMPSEEEMFIAVGA